MREFDPDILDHAAALAGLDPDPAGRAAAAERLARVDAWLAELDGVEAAGEDAADTGETGRMPPPPGPPLRDDVPRPGLDAGEATAGAPELRDGFFAAPRLRDPAAPADGSGGGS